MSNKCILLFFFLLIFNFSLSQDILNYDEKKLFNLLLNIIRGLTDSDENICVNTVLKNEEDITIILRDFRRDLQNGKSFTNLVIPYGLKILGITELISNCKILSLLNIYNQVTTKEGIKDIGFSIYNNPENILKVIYKIKTAKGLDNKIKYVGRLFSIIFTFSVS